MNINNYDDEYVIFNNDTQPKEHNSYLNLYNSQLNDDYPPPPSYDECNTQLVHDLFSNNDIHNEKQDISTLIDIYEKTFEKSGEFIDVNFRANLLPIRLHQLSSMTILNIQKCDLDELSYLPPLLEKLKCTNCNLKIISCKTFPSTLIDIDLSNNMIELICDFENLTNLKRLILDNNCISYINDIPKSTEIISIKQNNLTKITFLMENLREVHLSKNNITDIEELLDSIELLDISNNNIGMIVLFPLKLKLLNAYNCKLKKILCKFPPNLEKLDLYNNELEFVPDFPNSLTWADLSANDLRTIPNNIKNLTYLDISNNPNLSINPNEQSWKDFMMGMQDNKQFMMDFEDFEDFKDFEKSEKLDIYKSPNNSSNNTDTSDDEDSNLDEEYKINSEIFRQRIIKSPPFNNIQNISQNTSNYATFSFNKTNDTNTNINSDVLNLFDDTIDFSTFSGLTIKNDDNDNDNDNDTKLKEIINGIRCNKIKATRYVKFYKTYTL
jgi:Leucine-rich repeat (LRR) protein